VLKVITETHWILCRVWLATPYCQSLIWIFLRLLAVYFSVSTSAHSVLSPHYSFSSLLSSSQYFTSLLSSSSLLRHLSVTVFLATEYTVRGMEASRYLCWAQSVTDANRHAPTQSLKHWYHRIKYFGPKWLTGRTQFSAVFHRLLVQGVLADVGTGFAALHAVVIVFIFRTLNHVRARLTAGDQQKDSCEDGCEFSHWKWELWKDHTEQTTRLHANSICDRVK